MGGAQLCIDKAALLYRHMIVVMHGAHVPSQHQSWMCETSRVYHCDKDSCIQVQGGEWAFLHLTIYSLLFILTGFYLQYMRSRLILTLQRTSRICMSLLHKLRLLQWSRAQRDALPQSWAIHCLCWKCTQKLRQCSSSFSYSTLEVFVPWAETWGRWFPSQRLI